MFEKLLFDVSQCKSVQEATDLLCKFIDEHSEEIEKIKSICIENRSNIKSLEDFKGNCLSEEEKQIRLEHLKEEIKEGEVDEEMIPYINLLNSNKYCITTQCCYGHNGNNHRIAHIDFRSTLSIECVIDNILRPMEDKFGCNIQLFTEQDRLRYCIWMDNSDWQDQMRHLIYLFDSLEKANSIIEIFH